MTTDDIMALANKYAASNGKALLEKLYGTTRSYTEQCTAEAFQDRQALRAAIEKAAAELRRLHDENEALKAAQYECGFGAGCCYQAAKSEADEALLRQALEALDPPGQLRFGGTGRLKAAAIAAIKERLK